MHLLIDYFNTAPDWHRVIVLALSMGFFGSFSNVYKNKKLNPKFSHSLMNAMFVITAIPVQLLMGFLLLKTFHFVDKHHWGMANIFALKNPYVLFLFGFVSLDFFEYIYHVLMHKIKFLWRIHEVHHSDQIVDVSTVLREHPFETFVRLGFLLIWIFITGIPFWVLIFRQFIQIISNVAAHAAFRFPKKIDNFISILLVTPNMHQVHHHYKQPFTDNNYGDVLSIWDRIFGTFSILDNDKTIFGVDTHMDVNETSNFAKLIKMPFEKQ